MTVTDAELDDIRRDAESTARLVGAPGSPVRLRAEATVRLVAEVRRLRGLCREAADDVWSRPDLYKRLRAAGGES